MPQLPLAGMVWLLAGLGLGICLSMAFLALVVEADRRRLRRRLRPVAIAALVTDPLRERAELPLRVEAAKPRPAVAKPLPQAAAPDRERADAEGRSELVAVEPRTGPPAEEPAPVPAARSEPAPAVASGPVPAASEPPLRQAKPDQHKPLSVEEIFASAFKSADLTKTPPSPSR